jgi:CubicO group peptidase (beta-lactamase class C family)
MELQNSLKPLIATLADKWHTAFQLGFRSPECALSIASGYADPLTRRRATPKDTFLLGSVTKTITATAVMQLVEKGDIGINDSVTMHVDPFLARTNGTTLVDLWGGMINQVTVHDLMAMQSGLKDYDTEALRKWSYEHPSQEYTPLDAIWGSNKTFEFVPGAHGTRI